MIDIVKVLRNPPFGTETSERNIMACAADEIERLRNVIHQYRDDLQYPPSADSMQRRLRMIDDILEKNDD